MSDMEKWASDDGPFADNTSGAITAETFRQFASDIDAALDTVRLSLGMLLAEISDGSAPSTKPFFIDPDNPATGEAIPSKSVLNALNYEGDPWSTGQHIQLGSGRSYFWDGTAWQSGQND